jgi:cysteine synthase A
MSNLSDKAIAVDYAAASGLPRLVDLGGSLTGAAFDVMKTLPAERIVDRAIANGSIKRNTTVLESTSGTFRLGLAMVCALRGVKLHLVSDPAIEGFLKQRIEGLGSAVTVVTAPDPVGGFQTARLRAVKEIQKGIGEFFVPSQYSNPENPRAYAAVARQLVEALGIPAAVVGSVGSGGSMCGTVSAMRLLDANVRAIGVDTHGSVLFGQDDCLRELRGLGNSILPPNLDHSTFDEVHWVSAAMAYEATHDLHREHALYMGPTSGAAYLVARSIAQRTEGRTVVLLPDTGHRYEDTVYNPDWLAEHRGDRAAAGALPHEVGYPPAAGHGWQYIHWSRRTRAEVLAVSQAHAGASTAGRPLVGAVA